MKKSKVIAMAVLISGTALLCSKAFAADTAKTPLQSIDWTMKNLKAQAGQNRDKVEEEIDEVNPDTSISKFNMAKAKSRFEDVVFLGDSITEYLKVGGILDSSSVLAKKGEHVNQADKHIKEIEKLKPKQIVILYGANDLNGESTDKFESSYIELINKIKKVDKGVEIYIQAPLKVDESKAYGANDLNGESTDKFESSYIELINKIKKVDKGVEIYIQAPLKVDESKAIKKNDGRINNNNVAELDKRAKKVAEKTGAKYLSSDGLITSNNLYEPDGIHLKYDFYKNWLFFLSENL